MENSHDDYVDYDPYDDEEPRHHEEWVQPTDDLWMILHTYPNR